MKTGLRVVAGTCVWREITDEEKTIKCSKMEGGEITHGILVETGEIKRTITIDGKEIQISEDSYQELKKSLMD